MSHWFSQASQAFRSPASSATVEFQLKCACGRTIDGVREKRHQLIVCSSCAQQLFVLPVSAYPVPKTKKKGANSSKQSPKKNANGKTGAKATSGRQARTGATTSFSEMWRQQFRLLQQQLRQTLLRIWTPFHKVLLGIGLIVAMTVYGVWHMRSLDQARHVLSEAPQQGLDALHKRDFATAAVEFGKACRALDVLGKKGPEAQTLRQRLRESTAAGQLTPQSIFELVQEAIQAESASGLDWREAFRTVHRGGWLIIDTSAATAIDGEGRHFYRIELPILVQGHLVTMLADFSGFDALLKGSQSNRVIFAAQLEDFRKLSDNEETPGCEIVLAPKTSFLWSDADIFGALGFPLDDETKATLTHQSQLLGVDP